MKSQSEQRSRPWRGEYVSLADRYLSDEDRHRVYSRNPDLPPSYKAGCPTCGGAKRFLWNGREYECDCRQQLAMHKHYLLAGVPELYQRQDWDDYHGDAQILEAVQGYVEGHRRYVPAGLGLIFRGPFGTGKTLLAALVAKELIKLGYGVFFVTFAGMVEEFTKGWGDPGEKEWFEAVVVGSKVLVLDDVGKEFRGRGNLPKSTFDHVLRQRVAAMRPTIVTTNLSESDLAQGYGSSILSLLSEHSMGCWVDGSDWRPQALRRSLSELDRGERRPIT